MCWCTVCGLGCGWVCVCVYTNIHIWLTRMTSRMRLFAASRFTCVGVLCVVLVCVCVCLCFIKIYIYG